MYVSCQVVTKNCITFSGMIWHHSRTKQLDLELSENNLQVNPQKTAQKKLHGLALHHQYELTQFFQ